MIWTFVAERIRSKDFPTINKSTNYPTSLMAQGGFPTGVVLGKSRPWQKPTKTCRILQVCCSKLTAASLFLILFLAVRPRLQPSAAHATSFSWILWVAQLKASPITRNSHKLPWGLCSTVQWNIDSVLRSAPARVYHKQLQRAINKPYSPREDSPIWATPSSDLASDPLHGNADLELPLLWL